MMFIRPYELRAGWTPGGVATRMRGDWVDGGLPESSACPDLLGPGRVTAPAYVELAYLIRRLIGNDAMSAFRTELPAGLPARDGGARRAPRTRHWATQASWKSITDETISYWIPGTALLDLRMQPKSEAYVLTWFRSSTSGHQLYALPQAPDFPVDHVWPRADCRGGSHTRTTSAGRSREARSGDEHLSGRLKGCGPRRRRTPFAVVHRSEHRCN